MKLLLFISIFFSYSLFAQQPLVYPKANASNQADTIWGKVVKDPYRWMESINSNETKEWLQKEQQLTDQYNTKLYSSLKDYIASYSRIHFKRLIKQGKYYFSFMINTANETPSLYFQEYSYTEPFLLFNPNTLVKTASIKIDDIALSNNGNILALSLSKNGSDWNTIRFFDMRSKELMADTISFVKYSNIYWYKQGVFYEKYDVKNVKESFSGIIKGRALYYHKLGTSQKKDILVYKPQNEYQFSNFEVTPEGKYLILYHDTINNGTPITRVSSALLNDSLTFNFKVFISVISDKHISFNVLGFLNEKLIVQSNIYTPSGALYTYDPNQRNKKTLLIQPFKEQLEYSKIVGNKIITIYTSDTSSTAFISDSTGKRVSYLEIPSGCKFDFNHFSYSSSDNTLLYSFYSFYIPPIMFQFNLNSNKAEALGRTAITFNVKGFITKKIYYYSRDSTLIPMYLTYKKKIKFNEETPVLLYGYGGFGISMDPFYDPANVAFIESGGILATPCLRGGGDFPGWHEKGMGLNKQNTFDDFIAAAEHLISNKYTNPTKIAAMGGSNGGLLVDAVMLQRPDLFKAVVSIAGLLDMMRYYLYNTGYYWTQEYGTISDSTSFKTLIKYSPVHNVKVGVNYPATLLVASDNDDRVNPFHSFKFLAELQSNGGKKEPYLLYYEKGGGHNGSDVLKKQTETKAYIYSFIFKQLGMKARGW